MQQLLHTQPSKSEHHYCINTCKGPTSRKMFAFHTTAFVQACAMSPHAVSVNAFLLFGLVTILSLLAAFCQSSLRYFEPKSQHICLLFAFQEDDKCIHHLLMSKLSGSENERKYKMQLQNGSATS